MSVASNAMRRFPSVLRALRIHRGIQQKAVACELGVAASTYSSIESGMRLPFEDARLSELSRALQLTAEEDGQLRDAARHDRLLHQISSLGATADEVALFSATLTAWTFMPSQQRSQWLYTVQQLAVRARQVEELSRGKAGLEVSMP